MLFIFYFKYRSDLLKERQEQDSAATDIVARKEISVISYTKTCKRNSYERSRAKNGRSVMEEMQRLIGNGVKRKAGPDSNNKLG